MFNLANESHFNLTVGGLENTGLQVLAFEGKEIISKPYQFEVTLVNKNIRFDITKLLSRPIYLTFTPDGKQGIHGIVMSVQRGAIGHHYAEYKIIIAPRFTHLEKRTNQRIFQNKTVPQIITQILNEYGITEGTQHEFRVKDNYPERVYCVQYDETDAYFIQRLCQEEGIFYYFKHQPDNHLMIFGDSNPIFGNLEKPIIYSPNSGFVADYPVIKGFNVNLTSKTKRATWRDYNFTNVKIPEGKAEGIRSAKANESIEPDIEFYAYPGRFMDNARGVELAQITIERLRTEQVLAQGYSDVPRLCSGYYFLLEEHPSLDSKEPWLLNTIIHQGKQPQVIEALGGEKSAQLVNYLSIDSNAHFPNGGFHQGYRNCFTATPKDVPWRPPYDYPKIPVYGSQTAKVVGPNGQEIYCDQYGSVKVQFPWDREGQFNENSSCWVRVASNWAYKGYGAVTIPRINMEVLVTFLEGDPDKPVITGCIHNGADASKGSTVPYDLPANKTRTVFKTNSSIGGGGFNELRIEDKKDEEEIFIHAQKDQNIVVRNNETHSVGVNRVKSIGQDEIATMGRNRLRVVKEHDSLKVGINKFDRVGNCYHIETGTQMRLVCGETVIELNENGKLNITCVEFNITATKTGQINTLDKELNLNMLGKAIGTEAGGAEQKVIKDEVDQFFGGGAKGIEGSKTEQEQQKAVIPNNNLNEVGITQDESSDTPITNFLPSAPPISPAESPSVVNLSSMQDTFDQMWQNSFPDGKAQSLAGTLIKDLQTGQLSLIQTPSSALNNFVPDIPVGKEAIGLFRTNPYDSLSGGLNDISFNPADMATTLNSSLPLNIIHSGDKQYMLMRTAQTSTVDASNFIQNTDARIRELQHNGADFAQAIHQATQENANANGLAYYTGSNGIFKKNQ